jgi:hypothetical protein
LAQNIFTKKGIFLVSTIKVFSAVVCQPPLAHESAFLVGVCLAATWHGTQRRWSPQGRPMTFPCSIILEHFRVTHTIRYSVSLEARTRPSAFSVSCARDGGRRCVKNVKGAIKWLILTVDKLINGIPLEWLGRRSRGYAIAARRVNNSHDSKNSPEMCCCAPYLRPPRAHLHAKRRQISRLCPRKGAIRVSKC